MRLRPADFADIEHLNRIALRAKAHWGYAPDLLARWKPDLTLWPKAVVVQRVCVAEDAGRVIGFVHIAIDRQPWALDGLWVDPEHMRRGVGRALLAWAREKAALGRQAELSIDADPHAEAFYLAWGARRVGEVAAPIDGEPGRVRPQLVLPVAPVSEQQKDPGAPV